MNQAAAIPDFVLAARARVGTPQRKSNLSDHVRYLNDLAESQSDAGSSAYATSTYAAAEHMREPELAVADSDVATEWRDGGSVHEFAAKVAAIVGEVK